MKVFLLGSTGRLGNEILKKLIDNKIKTNILVRNQKNIKIKSKYLEIFVGDPLDKKKLEIAILNCKIVITTLNISRKSDFPWSKLRAPKTLLSETVSNLVHLHQKHNFDKIISISAWGVKESKNQLPFWFRWLIDSSNIRYGYLDHEKQEEILTNSNCNWMIVRPVGLSKSQKDVKPEISINSKPCHLMVSRKTVSKFILDNLNNKIFMNQIVTIS